tara:strand:- start:200 stop:577 length:378 start_codon:yes stop_codon:yes gene_type:complete
MNNTNRVSLPTLNILIAGYILDIKSTPNYSFFMSSDPDNLQILISKYRTMDIYELEANIDNWNKENDCPTQTQRLVIAKNVLEIKYKERQEQIELLTKSLTSSSRAGRWISSIKVVIKQLLKFNR